MIILIDEYDVLASYGSDNGYYLSVKYTPEPYTTFPFIPDEKLHIPVIVFSSSDVTS